MIEAILVVAALLVVPGAGASLALAAPGAISVESRVALAFGLGYGLVAGVATLLALAHAFTRPSFIAGVVVVTIAVWVLAFRRAPARAHASTLAAQVRVAPVYLTSALVLLLAVAVSRLFYPPERALAIRSSWRYWSDGLEIAAAGHVPATTHQWGIEFPTTVSKVVLNSFDGGVSFLLGADPLGPMKGILAVTAVGLVAALLALARELGFGAFAPLFAALVVIVPKRAPLPTDLSGDLSWYTAEDVGRLAAFSALLIGIYALRSRRPAGLLVATGALLALAGLSHMLPTMVAGIVLALFGVATALLRRERLLPVVARVAAVVAVFGVVYVGVLGLSGGDLGWQRAGGASFEGFPATIDPTRSFTRGQLVPKLEKNGHFLISPRHLLARLGDEVVNRRGHAGLGLVVLGVLSIAALVLAIFVRALLPAVAVAWGLTATIVLIALFFSYRYETLVPGDFGARRVYGYIGVVMALLLVAICEAVARLLKGTRMLAARKRLAVVALSALATAVAVVAVAERTPRDRTLTQADRGLKAIAKVAQVVPCGSRMLVNARTAGTWEATTGRLAVTEGHAPFLRPGVLERVLPVLIGANEFFSHPERNRDYLARLDVDYLVTVKPEIWIGTKGPRGPREGDAAAIARLDDVHPVLRDPLVSVFAVGSPPPSGAGPQPERCPLGEGDGARDS